jgi:hypothetical protein
MTRRHVTGGYGRWLAWLDDQGLLDPLVLPAERATKERVGAYAKKLQQTRSPFTVQGQIQALGDALRVMSPGADLRWISRGAGRLRNRARPVKDKRSRLQSPDRLVELALAAVGKGHCHTCCAHADTIARSSRLWP